MDDFDFPIQMWPDSTFFHFLSQRLSELPADGAVLVLQY